MTPVRRLDYPRAGHLVGVAIDPGGRLIDYGDLAAVIPRWTQTPLIAQGRKPLVAGRRFVSTRIARHWVDDLMTKQYTDQARNLADLIDWAENLEEVPTYATNPF